MPASSVGVRPVFAPGIALNARAKGLTTVAPRWKQSTQKILVGNPAIYDELVKLIGEHGDSQAPIKTKTPWDAVKMPVKSKLVEGLKLDASGQTSSLLLLSVKIYVEPQARDKRRTISFLIQLPGDSSQDSNEAAAEERLKQGIVLAVASHDGNISPFKGFVIENRQGDPLDYVHYKRFDAQKNKFVSETLPYSGASLPLAEQYRHDRVLFDALFEIFGYTNNSVGYREIQQGAEYDVGSKAVEEGSKAFTRFAHIMAAPMLRLADRYDAIVNNPELVAYYNKQDPDLLPFMRTMSISARKDLLLSREDSDHITELSNKSDKSMNAVLEEFRWKDKSLTRSEFYQVLRETKDPQEREELLKAYSQTVLKAHEQGLFPMIGELNQIANKYGYANYAEYIGQIMHGITPDEFAQKVDDFYANNKDRLVEFVRQLTGLNGGKPVHEWDVHYLADELSRQKLDGLDVPKIKFSDALKVAKRFFKDIGIDLDAAPFSGNIFYDTNKRENKYGNAFATGIGDSSRAWFNTNFDPNEEIALEDLGTIVHELTHDINFIAAAKRDRGNSQMGLAGTPNIWTEGIAVAVDQIVANKNWMDRYLADLPQFSDPKVRQAIADASDGLALYDQMLVMLRARFEINLYQEKNPDGTSRTLEERKNYWSYLARNYLHVEAMEGSKGGRVWATPHFAGMPGYYVSYSGGYPTAVKAAKSIHDGVNHGDVTEMQRGGDMLLHLFDAGARLSSIAEIDAEVDRYNGGK